METALVKSNGKGKDITTSLIVAEIFNKRHNNVMRDIQRLECSHDFYLLNFEHIKYLDSKGREQKAFEITKDGFSILAMGYTGPEAMQFKEKFIAGFNQRESLLKNEDYLIGRAITILKARTANLIEENNKLQIAIASNLKKVEYHDRVLQSETLFNTSTVAKQLGFASPQELNSVLSEHGIIYKKNNKGPWLLSAKYCNKGYTGFKTWVSDDSKVANMHMYWTQKGIRFLHEELKEYVLC